MAFLVRVLIMVVVMMTAPILQASHAIMYKVGDSVGWTTIRNVDHYNERDAAQIRAKLTYGGLNDKTKSWGLNNVGGDHHQQEEVDEIIHDAPKRTVFLMFNINYPPIDEQEVIDFFTKRFGAVESYCQRVPNYARIVFRDAHIASAVLRGGHERTFTINGIYVWAKKHVPPQP